MAETAPDTQGKQERTSGCLTRLTWTVLGSLALLLVARPIWMHEGSFFSWADPVCGAIVAGLILLRYVDISRLGGRTAFDRPATTGRRRRRALPVCAASLAVWGLAHLAAHPKVVE